MANGFVNDVMFAANVDFTGSSNPSATMLADGELLIGSSVAPKIRVGSLTSIGGTLDISVGHGTINLEVDGAITQVTLQSTAPPPIDAFPTTITPSGGNINLDTANSTVFFNGLGSTATVDFGLNFLVLGSNCPDNISGVAGSQSTVGFGRDCFKAAKQILNSVAVGQASQSKAEISTNATTGGAGSLQNCVNPSRSTTWGAFTLLSCTTTPNDAFGDLVLSNLLTGVFNFAAGRNAGVDYVNDESSNILICNNGIASENNTIRIGRQGSGDGQQNRFFAAGITGASPTSLNTPQVVLCDNEGQLTPITSDIAGYVLTSNGPGDTPTFQPGSGGGSGVYFQAYRTSDQTVAGGDLATTIIFDTAISNVGSAYDVSTGIFTAPSTGYYGFSCTANFGALATPVGLSQVILAYTGSVQSLRLEQFGLVPATTGAALICTASWAMPMTAGDTIQMQPFADGTGNYIISGAPLSSSSFNTPSTFSGWKIA